MPVYQKVKKPTAQLPSSAQRLLKAAASAVLGHTAKEHPHVKIAPEESPQWQSVAGSGVLPTDGKPLQANAAECAQTITGARLIRGWCIEEVRRKGIDRFAIVLEQHDVVQMPGGTHLCPGTPIGQEINFLPDPVLSQMGSQQCPDAPRWNRAIYTNIGLRGSLGSVQPFELTWATNWGNDLAFSSDSRHARFLSWASSDPTAYLIRCGLDPKRMLDVAMTSDLDELCSALRVSPPVAQLQTRAFDALLAQIRDLHAKGVFSAGQANPA